MNGKNKVHFQEVNNEAQDKNYYQLTINGVPQPILHQPSRREHAMVDEPAHPMVFVQPSRPLTATSMEMMPGNWMVPPQVSQNCPPGLEYLAVLDHLTVHQKVEFIELATGFDTKNRFRVRNELGQDIYFVQEDSRCLLRNLFGSCRPFEMTILDSFRNEVIHMHHPLACYSCCFPCCLQSMQVSAPPGTVIGTIQQEWSIIHRKFTLRDATGEPVLKIEGPFFTCTICRGCKDVEFKVTSVNSSETIGVISKQWLGFMQELYADNEHFGIKFPMGLDVNMKAVMLGACFLIDSMFYETTNY